MTVASIITQVPDINNNSVAINEKKSKQHLPNLLSLSLRGTRIDIDKDTLLSLPESILVVMFPQGFVLDGEQDNQPFCTVDFNMECLNYVLNYLQQAKENFKADEFAQDAYLAHAVVSGIPLNPLLTKQGIVVLREELDYFLVVRENNQTKLTSLKQKSGDLLVRQDLIFEALLQNMDKENNSIAEHHLVDMLCNAGFSRTDHWSHRSIEPNKTCRKCWWTKNLVTIDHELINLWCRRMWTLELILL